MNFLLDHIELHIDDSFVEIGERLLAKKALQNLFLSDKNLWLGSIKDGKTYEVEIQLAANRVKAMTCDCSTFASQKVCTHAAAVLLQLRLQKKLESEKKETAKSSPKPTKSNPKITVNAILQNISTEQLEHFVKTYARGNRNFSVALKTKFAANVEVENSQEKYVQVLHGAIMVHKSAKGLFSAKGMQQILKLAHQMIAQSEDMVALKNYAEGFSILEACLLKISPLLRFNKNSEENKNFIFRILQTTWDINSKEIAPDLRERIWSFLSQEAFKSFYFNENVEQYFFNFLLELTDLHEKMEQLIVAAQQQLDKRELNIENQVNLIAFQLALFEKSGQAAAAETLIEAYIEEDAILVLAMEDALKKENIARAKQLAASRKTPIQDRQLQEKVDELMLQIALKEKDVVNIKHFGQIRFLQTYDFKYFDLLKSYETEDKPTYNTLILLVKKHPYSVKKRDAIAQLHYREKEMDALFGYFDSIRSLDLLQSYDTLLIKEYKQRIYQLYEDLLLEYIKNHIGRKPSIKTSAIIQHLRDIGARDLAEHLVHIFRADYGERHTLMEELQFF